MWEALYAKYEHLALAKERDSFGRNISRLDPFPNFSAILSAFYAVPQTNPCPSPVWSFNHIPHPSQVGRLQDDHLAAVPDAKWPLLTVARLKEAQVSERDGGVWGFKRETKDMTST